MVFFAAFLRGFISPGSDPSGALLSAVIGPFDNDTAADFVGNLDEAAVEERESVIRGVLEHAVGRADYVDAPCGVHVAFTLNSLQRKGSGLLH
ncbi:DUF4259 domain-containing protein [Streptomyces sp. NPDC058231]|uniref:DUF4259 domain-containing protein n=1 Tax=Streptomyces sp. NPDC058231 TaxID=3346392 RepID=UPI0036F0530D